MTTIVNANLSNPQHAQDLLMLLDNYAKDPMGGGTALPAHSRAGLIAALQARPGVHAVLAYCDDRAAGLAICFEGFSTFACQALLNIHDFAVHPEFRGRGIGRRMMAHITELAQQQQYCKLTLEVLSGNAPALALYHASGFASYELGPTQGGAIMLQKKLTARSERAMISE